MIKINLLPEYLRQVDQPSPVRKWAIIGGGGVSAAALAFFLYVHLSLLPQAEELFQKAQAHRESLRPAQKDFKALNELIKTYRAQKDATVQIQASRIQFSRKLHEFQKVFQPHKVWIDNLSIISAVPPKNVPASAMFKWRSKCTGAGTIEQMNDFFRGIQKDAFSVDFLEIEPPKEYSKIVFTKLNEVGWNFNLELDMVVRTETPSKGVGKK